MEEDTLEVEVREEEVVAVPVQPRAAHDRSDTRTPSRRRSASGADLSCVSILEDGDARLRLSQSSVNPIESLDDPIALSIDILIERIPPRIEFGSREISHRCLP